MEVQRFAGFLAGLLGGKACPFKMAEPGALLCMLQIAPCLA
jgi:hypothetical protein